MKRKRKQFKEKGAIALILVIMVTSLTVVSSVVISLVNINDLLANYHLSEANIVAVDVDSCFNDALWRLAADTSVTGDDFSINYDTLNCTYQISAAFNNINTITATATTTSSLGSWTKSVVGKVDVSQEPFTIVSYKDKIN